MNIKIFSVFVFSLWFYITPVFGQQNRFKVGVFALILCLLIACEGKTSSDDDGGGGGGKKSELFSAYGPGGNEKTGLYHYGSEFPALMVKKSTDDASTCLMENNRVSVMNLNHQIELIDGFRPYSFTCFENNSKEINGAYSPINDAFFFGQVTYDMYQAYVGVPPLEDPKLIKIAVHYGSNYNNAFWNGEYAAFGDGRDDLYPLVSLDVVAHEISHGFSERFSGSIRMRQRAAINESFSDIAGEAAEFFLKGDCDFKHGADVVKAPDEAKRFLDDPLADGDSIDNAKDYYDGMNFYHAAGVFNKAFYLLAKTEGWNPKLAFEVFAKANMQYWTSQTDFSTGAHDVYNVAKNLGYDAKDVKDAFFAVGILVIGDETYAYFSHQTSFLSVEFSDLSASPQSSIVEWHWDFGDGTESSESTPTHDYDNTGDFPKVFAVTLTVEDQAGETAFWTENVLVSDDYCQATSNRADKEWIGDVTIGSYSNSTGASNYSDFTEQQVEVTAGVSYTISLSARYCTDCGEINEIWGVWIDLNVDGDFSDEGEMLLNVSGKGTIEEQIIFSNPNNVGTTRLRILMSGGASLRSCGRFPWGEVEDYTVEFIP